jgi:hypothetical protein
MPHAIHALARLAPLALLLAAMSAEAVALSNEAFAGRVRGLRQQMAEDPLTVQRAQRLCHNLPGHRAAEEPACVALRAHERQAGLAAPAPGAGLIGPLIEQAVRSVIANLNGDDA